MVTPGAAPYLYIQHLKCGTSESGMEFNEGKPYVAMRIRTDERLYAELWPSRREVRLRKHAMPRMKEQEHQWKKWVALQTLCLSMRRNGVMPRLPNGRGFPRNKSS